MSGATIDVDTTTDGTMVIRPHGTLDAEDALELRRTLVHAVRHVRPPRLVVDLDDLRDLDPFNLGTLAAVCDLGDDHEVAVFIDYPPTAVAERLAAAGVPRRRLRRVGARRPGDALPET